MARGAPLGLPDSLVARTASCEAQVSPHQMHVDQDNYIGKAEDASQSCKEKLGCGVRVSSTTSRHPLFESSPSSGLDRRELKPDQLAVAANPKPRRGNSCFSPLLNCSRETNTKTAVRLHRQYVTMGAASSQGAQAEAFVATGFQGLEGAG